MSSLSIAVPFVLVEMRVFGGRSVYPTVAPEEEGHGAGAGVASDGGADVVDKHFAVQVGEGSLHQISYGAGVVVAGGMADIALAAVGKTALGVFLHHLNNSVDDALLEELTLSFPTRLLCSEDCEGLCPKCGKPKRDGECSCSEKEIDPRLAVLKNFFADEEK
jgi:hypothetical protein